jgi:hypothetical protein
MSGTVEPLREVVGCVTSGTLLTLAWPPGLEPGTPHIRGSGAAPFVHVLTLDGAAAWVEFDHVDVYLPVRD